MTTALQACIIIRCVLRIRREFLQRFGATEYVPLHYKHVGQKMHVVVRLLRIGVHLRRDVDNVNAHTLGRVIGFAQTEYLDIEIRHLIELVAEHLGLRRNGPNTDATANRGADVGAPVVGKNS